MRFKEQLIFKLFTTAIVISPVLKQYSSLIPGISWADLILIIIVITIIVNDKKIVLNKKTRLLLSFWSITTFLSFVSFFLQQNFEPIVVVRYIKYSFYIFVVIQSFKYFDYNLGIKLLVRISTVVSVYVIIQYVFYNMFSVILPFKILPFPWASGSDFSITDVEYIANKYFYRPSGIFIEPAAASQFLLPGSIFALCKEYKSNFNKYMVFMVHFISIFLTTSTQGIIILLCVMSIAFVKNFKKPIFFTIGLGLILIVASIVVVKIDMRHIINENLLTLQHIQRGSSIGLRIFRGYAVFSHLPILVKIIGVGHGNLGNYVMANQIITVYDPIPLTEGFAEYANAFSLVLLYYGILGAILFTLLIGDILVNTKHEFKLLAYAYCLLMLSSGVFFNISIIFYFTLLYSGYGRKDKLWI